MSQNQDQTSRRNGAGYMRPDGLPPQRSGAGWMDPERMTATLIPEELVRVDPTLAGAEESVLEKAP